MAFVQATIGIVCAGTVGYILMKAIAPDDKEYTEKLMRGRPAGPSPLVFAERDVQPFTKTKGPIVPPTANPFYQRQQAERAAAEKSKEDTSKTGK